MEEREHYYLTSGNNILEEYHNMELDRSHIYNGSQRIATIVNNDAIYYNCTDHVSSSRALVDQEGNVDQMREYYPYGTVRESE